MVEVTVLLAVQSSDILAVNRSTEETIHTSGDSGWSLSIFHCKINSYAKVCIFYAYTVHDTENLTFSADNCEDDPCDVFLDPSAGCCARSSPSGFCHFQAESARKIRARPH